MIPAIYVIMQSDMWDHLKRSPYSTTGKLLTGIWQKFQTQKFGYLRYRIIL